MNVNDTYNKNNEYSTMYKTFRHFLFCKFMEDSYLTICGLFEYSLSVLMHGNCSKSKILDSFNRLTHILLLDYFGAVNLTSSLNNFRL